jgi:hypothetical protein
MMLGYYRLRKFDDARKSMQRLLTFAEKFRMDNPLVNFGHDVYQPQEPINLCYDTFGPAAGLMRGLFEYLYSAEGLTLAPHIPPGITALQQRDAVRFGKKLVYCSTVGSGPVTGALINGRRMRRFDGRTLFLPYKDTPDVARVLILLGGAKQPSRQALPAQGGESVGGERIYGKSDLRLQELDDKGKRLSDFQRRLKRAGLGRSYVAAHAQLALRCIETAHVHFKRVEEGSIVLLPEASQKAADQSYIDTARKLCEGLEKVMETYKTSPDREQKMIYSLWQKADQRKKQVLD